MEKQKKFRVTVKDNDGKRVVRYIPKEYQTEFNTKFKGIIKESTLEKWLKQASKTSVVESKSEENKDQSFSKKYWLPSYETSDPININTEEYQKALSDAVADMELKNDLTNKVVEDYKHEDIKTLIVPEWEKDEKESIISPKLKWLALLIAALAIAIGIYSAV